MMELILLMVFSGLLGLGCLGAVGWVLLSGAEVGVERIFLVGMCLLLAALFFGMSGWIALQGPLQKLTRSETAPNPESASAPKQKAAPKEVQKSAS